MLEDSLITKSALFFFYSIENELVAWEAAQKTLGQVQSLLSKNSTVSPHVILVQQTSKNWEKYREAMAAKSTKFEGDLAFTVKEGVDLGAWRQFSKDAEKEELLSVIWSKVLKLSDEEIAEGIGVTPGTVRHRVGRGLRHLGELKMY